MFGPSGFWTMALLSYAAKFDPFLSLDCDQILPSGNLGIRPEQVFFLFVNDVLPATSATMGTLYEEHRDDDSFIYIAYSGQSAC